MRRSGGGWDPASEDTDIGDGSRVGLRFGGGFLVAFADFEGREARGSSSSSSSESSSSAPTFAVPASPSLSSSSSTGVFDFLRAGGTVFFAVLLGIELSDSVVGMRGTFEGRCGLNAGAFRFDAGYTTVSFTSLRGGILMGFSFENIVAKKNITLTRGIGKELLGCLSIASRWDAKWFTRVMHWCTSQTWTYTWTC